MAIPVFIGILFGNQLVSLIQMIPSVLLGIFDLAGGLLPLIGFALLMSMINIKRYWPFLLAGYFLIAYTSSTIIGLTFAAAAICAIYAMIKNEVMKQNEEVVGDEID